MEGEEECSSNGEILPLPDSFVEFLCKMGLDSSVYRHTNSTPRYIRVKPGFEHQIQEIEADQIKCKLQSLAWMPNFYSLPPDIRIASLKAYKEGKIYGIDAASGAVVTALGISPGDHVLDLCAAPGLSGFPGSNWDYNAASSYKGAPAKRTDCEHRGEAFLNFE